MIVYLAQDIPAFVMYCVNGASRSFLLIECIDSIIDFRKRLTRLDFSFAAFSANYRTVRTYLVGALSKHVFEHACALYIANVAQRTFENVQNSISRRHGDIIIWTNHVEYIRVPRLPRARHRVTLRIRKLRADFLYDNGVVEICLLHICTGETSI